MSSLYREAANCLRLVQAGKATPKAAAVNSKFRNKRKLLAVLSKASGLRVALGAALKGLAADVKASLMESTRNDVALLKVLLAEQLVGGGIQGGGRAKRAIKAAAPAITEAAAAAGFTIKSAGKRQSASLFPRYVRCSEHLGSPSEALEQLDTKGSIHPVASDVLVLPSGTDLHKHPLVRSGRVVLQDLASALPARALLTSPSTNWPPQERFSVVDACAAPGNKTSQLVSIAAAQGWCPAAATGGKRRKNRRGNRSAGPARLERVYAIDRSTERLELLQRRMDEQHASGVVETIGASFLDVTAEGAAAGAGGGGAGAGEQVVLPRAADAGAPVRAVLLDPSCSGSGMRLAHDVQHATTGTAATGQALAQRAEELSETEAGRVERLAEFQEAALLHALAMPTVCRVSYSTCSVHERENEQVVATALAARPEFRLIPALPAWKSRGRAACGLSDSQAACLMRADPAMDHTCGFFVAVFERVQPEQEQEAEQEAGGSAVVEAQVVQGQGVAAASAAEGEQAEQPLEAAAQRQVGSKQRRPPARVSASPGKRGRRIPGMRGQLQVA